MIDIFNKFNDTVLYKDGNTLQNKIKELKLKLDNCSIKEKEKIKNDIKKYEYGLKGEANIIYELMNSHIPMYILHDINIEYKGYKAQISKVGYLYNSIEDKELHDRCGDILLGETAFDRAINQATQILEDRIKKKANLEKTNLIGIPLVSKAIHAKVDQTILKFSDEPDIQEGYSFMFKGIISIYRNQTHHSLNFKCNREYALKFCSYIDELLKDVDRSVVVNEK